MPKPCSICVSPLLAAVNKGLDDKTSSRKLAASLGLDRGSIVRHASHRGPASAAIHPAPPGLAARVGAVVGDPNVIVETGDRAELIRQLWALVRGAKTEGARVAAAARLDDMLPPAPPADESNEPTPADARRAVARFFGDAVSAPEPDPD